MWLFPLAQVELVCPLILPWLLRSDRHFVGRGLHESTSLCGEARRRKNSFRGERPVDLPRRRQGHHCRLRRGDLHGGTFRLRRSFRRQSGFRQPPRGKVQSGRRDGRHFVTPSLPLAQPGRKELLRVLPKLRLDLHCAQNSDEYENAHFENFRNCRPKLVLFPRRRQFLEIVRGRVLGWY